MRWDETQRETINIINNGSVSVRFTLVIQKPDKFLETTKQNNMEKTEKIKRMLNAIYAHHNEGTQSNNHEDDI